jgi:hypothetical protein
MLTLNVTNRIIMKITVWLIPTRQRFDNCLLKKFNYKSELRCAYYGRNKARIFNGAIDSANLKNLPLTNSIC